MVVSKNMQQTISKFNLYEHLAYILVGLFQIILGYSFFLIYKEQDIKDLLIIFELKYSIAIILFSYFIGHFIQALSNIFSKKEHKKKEQNSSYSFVKNKAIKFFDIPETEGERNVFQYCYFYVLLHSDCLGKELLLFNSLYGLYRGFYFSSLFSCIVCGFFLFVKLAVFFCCQHIFNYNLILYFIITIVLLLVFKRRAERFFDYLGKKTYIGFDVSLKAQIKA